MKWLLAVFGLLSHCSTDRDNLMSRVRTASNEHTAKSTSSSLRVEDVIFRTKHSGALASMDNPQSATAQIDTLLRSEKALVGRLRGNDVS